MLVGEKIEPLCVVDRKANITCTVMTYFDSYGKMFNIKFILNNLTIQPLCVSVNNMHVYS